MAAEETEVGFVPETSERTRAELVIDGRQVSHLRIVHMTIRIGAAQVRMDGIADVGTEEDCRHRGYSRRVLEATVRRMMAGDGALSMLYGIWDFYPKFGYASAGPDQYVFLDHLQRAIPMPEGARIRPLAPADLPAVRRLYERATEGTVGTKVRPEGDWTWGKLTAVAEGRGAGDECRVLELANGELVAYLWRGADFWYIDKLDSEFPDSLVLAEVEAEPRYAEAALEACRRWAVKRGERNGHACKSVLLSVPPAHPLARAAAFQSSRQAQRYAPTGDSMARVLNVERLLRSLEPELSLRAKAADLRPAALRIETEIGAETLAIGPDGVRVVPEAGDALRAAMPQHELARLALGAFEPADVLARLRESPGREAEALLEALFPRRQPHMNLPDRY